MISQKHLGFTVRDRITGTVGVLTGVVDYITGCSQGLVQPAQGEDKSKWVESRWFDVQRLETVDSEPQIILDNSKTPGACEPAPIR